MRYVLIDSALFGLVNAEQLWFMATVIFFVDPDTRKKDLGYSELKTITGYNQKAVKRIKYGLREKGLIDFTPVIIEGKPKIRDTFYIITDLIALRS